MTLKTGVMDTFYVSIYFIFSLIIYFIYFIFFFSFPLSILLLPTNWLFYIFIR